MKAASFLPILHVWKTQTFSFQSVFSSFSAGSFSQRRRPERYTEKEHSSLSVTANRHTEKQARKEVFITIQQIQRLLDSPSLSPSKAARIYLFACLSSSHYSDLPVLRARIQKRYHLDALQLKQLIEEQEAKWSARQEKAEALIRQSAWMKRFEQRFAREDQRTLDQEKAVYLMTSLLSLVLQNASVLSCSNRLHKKDVLCLLDMLESPAFLKPLTRQIQKPVLDCSRNIYPPFSEEYVIRVLALVQNLSVYYLQALTSPQSGLLDVITRTIRLLPHATLEETAEFLNPPRTEAERMNAAGIHFEEPRSLQKNESSENGQPLLLDDQILHS